MSFSFQKVNKNCPTCNFWGGERQVDHSSLWVKVESNVVKGKCLCQGSPFKGMIKEINGTCHKWEKWSFLK